ncbi:MAG: tetratricopeptide repeat protein [Bryobacteraceae bacterium]
MFRRFMLCALAAAMAIVLAPVGSRAADPKLQELQRDVASLQEQVRQLKESQDKQLAALTVLVQQALDTSNRSNTVVAVIQNNLQQSLKDMESKVVTPVTGLGARLDGMDQDMRALQQSVTDLNGMMGKLQQQMTDLNNAVKILQTPPPPPPTAATGSEAAAAAVPDTPTISAQDLYANANRDRGGKKYDLAMQEYQQYLKWYGNTDLAANAQFYIGDIHYRQKDFEAAVRDFDMVLEKYSENNKTPDALYSKGLALKALSRLTESHSEFLELIKRYPRNDLAAQACDQLKSMGYNCPVAKAPAKTTKKK